MEVKYEYQIRRNKKFNSCDALKKELWFDNLASALLLENLAEIAEADRKIEETEIKL